MTAARRTALLDVNVLIALAWPNHAHHAAARQWFSTHAQHGWATTPITESGFVRVSSNRAAIPTATSPVLALEVLTAMTGLDRHEFWVDDVARVTAGWGDPVLIRSHRDVTDAHLLSLANATGCAGHVRRENCVAARRASGRVAVDSALTPISRRRGQHPDTLGGRSARTGRADHPQSGRTGPVPDPPRGRASPLLGPPAVAGSRLMSVFRRRTSWSTAGAIVAIAAIVAACAAPGQVDDLVQSARVAAQSAAAASRSRARPTPPPGRSKRR